MALIDCPECEKQVSDKAESCPYCGYPIKDTLSDNNDDDWKETKYKLLLKKYVGNEAFVAECISNHCFISIRKAEELVSKAPTVIMDKAYLSQLEKIQKELSKYRIITDISEDAKPEMPKITEKDKNTIKCPTCGSERVSRLSDLKRGTHALIFGLYSTTAKSQFECLNCHYKW